MDDLARAGTLWTRLEALLSLFLKEENVFEPAEGPTPL